MQKIGLPVDAGFAAGYLRSSQRQPRKSHIIVRPILAGGRVVWRSGPLIQFWANDKIAGAAIRRSSFGQFAGRKLAEPWQLRNNAQRWSPVRTWAIERQQHARIQTTFPQCRRKRRRDIREPA